jgi:thioredoxin reductase
MTRAHLADPHLVRKAREGRMSETTRCVGANVCVARALRGIEVACVVNPVTGREERWGAGSPIRADVPRRVVVVGGGPAGLRVAATAAARGHDVTVFEADGDPGGHLRDLAWLPTRQSWYRAIDELVASVEGHGGQIKTGSSMELGGLLALSADAIVVATGATWDETGASARRPDRGGIPGIEGAAVHGLGAALAHARRELGLFGGRVVILDETGTYAPLGLAEVLAAAGAGVHVVTPGPTVGAEAAAELELPHVMPRLRELGVDFIVSHDIGAIDGRRVVLDDVWGGEPSVVDEVDAIVLAMQRTPVRGLVAGLRAAGRDVRLVGDARAPRTTLAVIHEAEALGRVL